MVAIATVIVTVGLVVAVVVAIVAVIAKVARVAVAVGASTSIWRASGESVSVARETRKPAYFAVLVHNMELAL